MLGLGVGLGVGVGVRVRVGRQELGLDYRSHVPQRAHGVGAVGAVEGAPIGAAIGAARGAAARGAASKQRGAGNQGSQGGGSFAGPSPNQQRIRSAGRSDHLLVALRTTLSGASLSSRYDRSPRSSLLSMYGLESPKSHT